MTDKEFRCFLDLLMCSDPWPLDQPSQKVLEGLADREAKSRGFDGWIEAYHKVKI